MTEEIDTAAIRAQHHPIQYVTPDDLCDDCNALWPCEAIRLCDALDASRAECDRRQEYLRAALTVTGEALLRAERAEGALADVQALCDNSEAHKGPYTQIVHTRQIRAAIEGGVL